MVDHPIQLRGLLELPANPGAASGAPTLVQRTDLDFLPAIFEELKTGLSAIAPTLAKTVESDGVLRLFQPIHRTFHVVLLEAVCDPYGVSGLQPRLDPQSIESMGLVLRRFGEGDRAGQLEGWRQKGTTLQSWIPFADDPVRLRQDPDPARRPPTLQSGHPELNRRLTLLQAVEDHLSESISPLFIAPPAVGTTTNKTILYGLVPVTSAEMSETPDPAFSMDFIQTHLPTYFRARSQSRSIPRANATLTPNDATASDLQDFIAMLRQVQLEFEAFQSDGLSQALFQALNQIQVPRQNQPAEPAGSFLKKAAQVLVDRISTNPPLQMPLQWPPVSSQQADSIANAVKAILDRRLGAAQPQRRRFDDLNRQYCVQAFIRVKRPDGCPPQLVWSEPSAPFRIANWYDASDVAPVQVTLPDVLEPNKLKALKPNVAFAVPSSLFNALNGMSLQDLLEGKSPQGGNPALDWICGFNIPIITLCAFIVLNIFLQLLNFIFQWIFFVKICIPFPRSQNS